MIKSFFIKQAIYLFLDNFSGNLHLVVLFSPVYRKHIKI